MENSPYDTHNETRANSILKYVKLYFSGLGEAGGSIEEMSRYPEDRPVL